MTTPNEPALDAPESTANGTRERTSTLLRQVLAELPNGDVQIGDIVHRLRHRSFGGLILLLAMLGFVPAVSVLAGIALIMPGLQLLSGYRAPKLPRFIRERQVSAPHLRTFGGRALPYIEALERYVRPRWLWLTSPLALTLSGVIVTALACVLLIPLPFSNVPPSVALICLSLGLMERDGLLVIAGLLCTVIALIVGGFVFFITLDGLLPYIAERLG